MFAGYKICCPTVVCASICAVTLGIPSISQAQTSERPVLPPAMHGLDGHSGGQAIQPSDFFDRLSTRTAGAAATSPQILSIATYDDRGVPALLARGAGLELASMPRWSDAAQWTLAPAGIGVLRIQTYANGRMYALSTRTAGSVSLSALSQDARQLWRLTGAGRVANRYILESVQYPGQCLTNQLGGQVFVQPITFAPSQLWVPLVAPNLVAIQPTYRTVRQEIQANPLLPPAHLELFNSHRYPLLVLLSDSQRANQIEQLRIEPNTAVVVTLERDAGSTIIETSEIRSLSGVWEQQQLVTTVPPLARYDLSIYEEYLQSIAIDRTGKSPNPIEDVNYVPKSVGWVPIPAGTALPAQGRVDIYAQAKSANNPGAVRRFNPKQFDESPRTDPLESILQEFQVPRYVPRQSF